MHPTPSMSAYPGEDPDTAGCFLPGKMRYVAGFLNQNTHLKRKAWFKDQAF
ncbi:hypothetical protein EDC63_11835 [Sulfurirhabdus autotrophica]|uniref:Uncharacterized protein n=1 Tax=Sulfurirhabdus autotrophica TaxID=1706046 RepID=A0A4R3XUJ3_9PROT|nr:hypothetical protein EDC63_11835 [Sulfurirhabdus autotrophica]